MDKLDFLDAPQGAAEPVAAPQSEPQSAPEPQQDAPGGPARGPDGRFLPKDGEPAPQAAQAEPAPAPEPAPAAPPAQAPAPAPQPEPAAPPPGHVPLPVMLDEREKRQETERRNRALEDEIAALRKQNEPPLVTPPDPATDPEGARAYEAFQFEERLFTERANISERLARKEHGDDLVGAAQQWAGERQKSDPAFFQRIRSVVDPYELVVAEYRRDQALAAYDPVKWAAYEKWAADQAANPDGAPPPPAQPAPAQGAPPAQAPPAPPPPPRSLASQPAAGGAKPGEQPVGPGVSFNSVFTK